MVCSVASVAWCVFLSGDAKKGKNEKALPCAHITQGIYEEKSIALSSFATFFFTFQKEERERERLIFVERTTLNKSTRRAHAQNNETGNT